jgi:hypothetical protein
MAIRRLGLTRDQLAKFLVEHEQIRQFELLFSAVDEIQTTSLDAVTFDVGTALAGVNKLAGVVAQLAQDGAIEASTALSVAQAAERALNAVSDLAMVGATLPPPVPKRRNVGAWVSTSDQAPTLANTAYPVALDAASIERGIWRDSVNTSRIYVADAGIYNFETSIQLDKVGGGAPQIWIWARVDGVDVADSASLVHLQGSSDELIFSANWLLELAANSYFELTWASDDTGARIEYFPAAAPVPAIPSVILTATQGA